MKLNENDLAVLVRLVAMIDAGFVPVRDWNGDWGMVAGQFRQRHRAGLGISYSERGDAGATGANVRKQNELSRNALAAAGCVRLINKGTKNMSAIVTPLGDAVARTAAGLPPLWEIVPRAARPPLRSSGIA